MVQQHQLEYPIYINDFKYLEKFKYSKPNLQTFTKRKKETNIKEILKFYCKNSTVHGAIYLGDMNSSAYIRLMWAVLIFSGIFGIIYTCNALQNSYASNVIKNIMVTGILQSNLLPFPAIVICNNYFLNWNKIEEAKRKFLPSNATEHIKNVFVEFFWNFEFDYYIEITSFKNFDDKDLKDLDKLNVTEVLEFLSFNVNETMKSCKWRYQSIECSKIFFKQKTQMGFCFIFNSIINPSFEDNAKILAPDMPYPWRVSSSGAKSGLELQLIPFVPKHFRTKNNNGFFIRTVDSNDWPSKRGDLIRPNTFNNYLIDLTIIEAEEEVRSLNAETRHCIFEDEIDEDFGFIESKFYCAGCRLSCRLRKIIAQCQCAPEIFIPRNIFKSCTASDYKCISVNHTKISNFTYSLYDTSGKSRPGTCNCYSYCSVAISDTELVTRKNRISNITTIDFHYRKDAMSKFQSYLSFNWIDYMVYFGGISSTYVGTSLMSLWECFFYIFMIIFVIINNLMEAIKKNKIVAVKPYKE